LTFLQRSLAKLNCRVSVTRVVWQSKVRTHETGVVVGLYKIHILLPVV